MGKARALAGDWDGVVVEAKWVETALGQVPAGIVCAPVAGQGFPTRQALPAMR